MLISFSCENILSFKNKQLLSLVATEKEKDNILLGNTLKLNEQDRLLKSAIIFGANGGGKTNLLSAILDLYKIVVHSLEKLKDKEVGKLTSFLLDHNSRNRPTEYEIEFLAANNITYRYGISFIGGDIREEWLFCTYEIEEVLLFHREGNSLVGINQEFKESSKFVNEKIILQTKKNIPFVSVLASFGGEHSSKILEWFTSMCFFGGGDTKRDLETTLEMWKDDPSFRTWAKPVLRSIGIVDIRFEKQVLPTVEEMKNEIIQNQEKIRLTSLEDGDTEIKEKAINLFDGLLDFISSASNYTQDVGDGIDLGTVKLIRVIDKEEFGLPFSLESSGTKNLLHMLGSMFKVCKSGGVLFYDEFDVGFHTLLSKYLIKQFHSTSDSGQIIITAHDTALMSTDTFRRDQIWLADKSAKGESQLYSLVEFKELALNIINRNYSDDYLSGFFEAIPLFDNLDFLEGLGKDE